MFMYQPIPSKGRPSPRTFDLKTLDLEISVGKKIVDVLYETTLILCLFFLFLILSIDRFRFCQGIFSHRHWSMFMPLVRYLDVVVLTCFPIYICSCLVVPLNILSFASSGQLDSMWSIVSSYLLHILHIGSVPSFIILA